MSVDQQLTVSYLERAIEEFDHNPVAPRFLRRLANERPELFFNAAMEHLSSDVRSNGHRFLALLVLREDSLLERLTNPAFTTRERAVNLFKRFLEVDPLSDVRLAQMLPSRDSNVPDVLNGSQCLRALDMLDATSPGRRLVPLLGHLLESGNPHSSARATLFVGRRLQSPEWTARLLLSTDQGVRANAVEALWGVKSPTAIRLFEDHTEDANNRVGGNSLVGLHLGEQFGVAETILGKSLEVDFGVRATAAWAMGRIGGDIFYDRLARLVRDEHSEVRSIALRALVELRRTEPKVEEKPVTLDIVSDTEPEGVILPETVPCIDLRLDGSSFRARH